MSRSNLLSDERRSSLAPTTLVLSSTVRNFDKAKSTGRIDALVALAMALSLALLRAEKQIDIRALIG